ncbi:hypothetical protein GUI12_03285 [Anaplasmataceae bacterium AB001_6]|nr:hypothetical protein GUI12_03285 [Anaplasmataceae bacterium AB001_6]
MNVRNVVGEMSREIDAAEIMIKNIRENVDFDPQKIESGLQNILSLVNKVNEFAKVDSDIEELRNLYGILEKNLKKIEELQQTLESKSWMFESDK